MIKREQIRPNLYTGTPLRPAVKARPLIGAQEIVAFVIGALVGALITLGVMM